MAIHESSYDDRLASSTDVESVLNTAEDLARELAEEHAPNSECPHCAETPLSCEWAVDVPKARKFDDLCLTARDRIEEFGEDSWFVRRTLGNVYENAFFNACPAPSECWVCYEASVDPELECGHQKVGKGCPAHRERTGQA